MDPINNQTPTPSPVSTPTVPPVAPAEPAVPVAPVAPVEPAVPVAPVAPAEPDAPATPVVPVEPTAPATPVTPPEPAQPSATPNPIMVNPGQANNAVNPAMNSMFVQNSGLVGATDPITVPAPPKSLDPVEEELKAPFKATGPVPGSIGSAISVPADAAPVPEPGRAPNNVSFNDPTAAENPSPASAKPAKKKTSKSTLILLAIIAGLVVIGLAGYLIMTLAQ